MLCRYNTCRHPHPFVKKSSLQEHLRNHVPTNPITRRVSEKHIPSNSDELVSIERSPFAVHSSTDLLICLECGEGIEIQRSDSLNPGQSHLIKKHTREGYSSIKSLILDAIGERRIYINGLTLLPKSRCYSL
jgi:hypothetical protein